LSLSTDISFVILFRRSYENSLGQYLLVSTYFHKLSNIVHNIYIKIIYPVL
jgi:hypothetical protein